MDRTTDPGRSGASDLPPILTTVSAAISSLAFFRPWAVFLINDESTGRIDLTGAALARDVGGVIIPWIYATPGLLLGVLAVSGMALFLRRRSTRAACVATSTLLAVPVLIWPVKALIRVTHNLSRFQVMGPTRLTLTPWWWIYSTSLAVIILSGIIFLLTSIPRGKENS